MESRWNGVGRQPDLSFLSSPSSYMAPLAQLMLFNVVGVGDVNVVGEERVHANNEEAPYLCISARRHALR